MTVYFVYFMNSEENADFQFPLIIKQGSNRQSAPQKVFQAGNTERQLQIKKLGSRINSNW